MKKNVVTIMFTLISLLDVYAQQKEVYISSSQLNNTHWKWVSPSDSDVYVILSFSTAYMTDKNYAYKTRPVILTMTRTICFDYIGKKRSATCNYYLSRKRPDSFGQIQTIRENDFWASHGPTSAGKYLVYSQLSIDNSYAYPDFSCDEITAFSNDSLTFFHKSEGGIGDADSYMTYVRIKK